MFMMTSLNQKVKVVEVCKVGPLLTPPSTTTITTTQSSLQLTHFDCFWLDFPPTQRVFFYETSDGSTTILPKLKHSLSVTLQHYLPLAGKLTWPPEHDKPIVRFIEGDGVSLTIAEAPEDDCRCFTEENTVSEAEVFCSFVPELSSTDVEAAVMALQVTFFGGKGYSIGYSAHHAVVDGKSVSMFLHAWATCCRNIVDNNGITEADSSTPYYDRTITSDPTNVETEYLKFWLEQHGPNNRSLLLPKSQPLPLDSVRKTFALTPQAIGNIKRSIQTQWKGEVPAHLSTFTATVSYVWVCLVKSKNMMVKEDDPNEKYQFGFTADVRGRLQPPIPSTYSGNCIVGPVLTIPFHELVQEDGVATAAKAIANVIEGLKERVILRRPGVLFSPKGLLTTVAGSPKFQLYNVDFGWGKPSKVEMVSINHSRAFALEESRDGNGGLEIGIVLRKYEMEIFSSLFAGGLEDH